MELTGNMREPESERETEHTTVPVPNMPTFSLTSKKSSHCWNEQMGDEHDREDWARHLHCNASGNSTYSTCCGSCRIIEVDEKDITQGTRGRVLDAPPAQGGECLCTHFHAGKNTSG